MANDGATIIAALIGAVIGSLGAKLVEELLRRRAEKLSLEHTLINQYLLQLEDAIESLWYRLQILHKIGFESQVAADPNFEGSLLYSLACVLAHRRILLLEGGYSKMEQVKPGLGSDLNKSLIGIDSISETRETMPQFFRYDRITLAETVIRRNGDRLGTYTYIEFKKQYEDINSGIEKSLKPAKKFLFELQKSDIEYFMDELKPIAIKVGHETHITSSLEKEEKRSTAE
jgi:hypothetical protein